MTLPILTPTDFVALANQTLEFAYPFVEIEGEVTNYKVSRNRWVYFDIADETSKLRCFGTVYMLPGPVEDGMKVRIAAAPKLHPQFGFSLNMKSLQFSGEGTIKKASDLLQQQLEKEGLFAHERKRSIPYPPAHIGLITSAESAAYKDFIKVLAARFGGVRIDQADVQVQGEAAVGQIVRAIDWFNKQAEMVDVLVIVRGGGSADDLQAFSSEQVTRAVASSRIPTLVAIGHEVDVSLAELAADQRASTPSNAAELLVPDRKELQARSVELRARINRVAISLTDTYIDWLIDRSQALHQGARELVEQSVKDSAQLRRTLDALSPKAILKRGYAVVRQEGTVRSSAKTVTAGTVATIEFHDGTISTKVQ